ncbi:MAG: type II secretion system F family protein, partial [Candidatus Bathyarchaeia archaeon]
RVHAITSRFTAFKQVYQKSGISRLYESYIALMLFALLVVFVSTFAIGAILHHFLFNLTLFRYLVAVLTFSCTISLTVPIMFLLYPLYRRGQQRKEIDANLVYTTGYMGVLSAGGISIERMFERVIQVEQYPAIKNLAKRFITNIKIFGLDVTSSLRDVTLCSPSEAFSKLLIGITNTVKTSGDLKGLLAFETTRFLHAKREQQKKTLGTLIALGEIYIAAMVMGPIVFIVMITILSIMGNVTFGLTPVEQLNLLVFFGLPIISTLFIVILNGVIPEED